MLKFEAKSMMDVIINENKFTNYKVCYDERLVGFKDKHFVKGICDKYYGEHGRNICVTKASFCLMCCEFHIGMKFPLRRVRCRKNCNKNIKGKLSQKEIKEEFKKKKQTKKKINEARKLIKVISKRIKKYKNS